jgi:hypothetical protein
MSDGLRDIKPLLEIPDSSYYLYLGLIVMGVLMILGVIFFAIKLFFLNREVDIKKLYFEELSSIDWIDTKKSAYKVTLLAHHFIDDEKVYEIYQQTLPLLEPYKYRKDVPTVDKKTRQQYEFLVHVIDESL